MADQRLIPKTSKISAGKELLRRAVKRPLNALGLDLVSLENGSTTEKRAGGKRSWKERLEHARDLGFAPRTILDGGAFTGLWSAQVAALYPGAQLILIEPNPFLQDRIRESIPGHQPVPIILNVALGECATRARLNIWGEADADAGASLLDHVSGPAAHTVEVEVETLDHIAERLALYPDLVKLDLQGAELAALKGGPEVLKHAELAIVEFGCLEAYVHRTSPRHLLDLMYENDFCLYDIASLGDRPYDGALTGGDFFFVKNSSQLRSHKGWA